VIKMGVVVVDHGQNTISCNKYNTVIPRVTSDPANEFFG
jgi:hypothetical protein